MCFASKGLAGGNFLLALDRPQATLIAIGSPCVCMNPRSPIRSSSGRLSSAAEQRFCKPWVVGSIPTAGSTQPVFFGTFSHDFRIAECLLDCGLGTRLMTHLPIEPGLRVGHVHLKVSDLERSLAFYRDVIGLELTQRFGTQAAFLSAGGYHHHIGLNTWESAHGRPPAPGTTGLYHAALLYPSRGALGRALQRLLAAGVELEGAADHGVSEALYLRDPDANGIELYWDLPRDCWPRDRDGGLAMFTRPLDLGALLEAAEAGGTC